jgi:hypothetical protein
VVDEVVLKDRIVDADRPGSPPQGKSFGRLEILHSPAPLTSVDVVGGDAWLADLDQALFE